MKTINNDLKKYYRGIKKSLLGSSKDKKRLICDLKNRVDDFFADNPNATIYTVESHFGTPQQVANEFNAYLSADEIRCEKGKKRLKYILFALSAIALIAIIVVATYIVIETYTDRPVYYEENVDYTNAQEVEKTTIS